MFEMVNKMKELTQDATNGEWVEFGGDVGDLLRLAANSVEQYMHPSGQSAMATAEGDQDERFAAACDEFDVACRSALARGVPAAAVGPGGEPARFNPIMALQLAVLVVQFLKQLRDWRKGGGVGPAPIPPQAPPPA
jgi:hypothetical protein